MRFRLNISSPHHDGSSVSDVLRIIADMVDGGQVCGTISDPFDAEIGTYLLEPDSPEGAEHEPHV